MLLLAAPPALARKNYVQLEARSLVGFDPLRPGDTLGQAVQTLTIHVRDHKMCELEQRERSLEAHFDTFVFTQARKGRGEARRWALEVGYGTNPEGVDIAGREGRLYALGPEPEPGDIDPRMPAVVAWFDGELFFLIASERIEADDLLSIARSCYRAA